MNIGSVRHVKFALRRGLLGLVMLVGGATSAAAQSETIEYYGLDQLGSVRVIFNQNGQQIDRMDYGPFGENLKAAIKMAFEQFGQLARDAETGQDYAKARNYSPSTGRFNRVDPVYAGLFDPQQWNRYAYVRNNPGRFTDPSGMCAAALCFNVTDFAFGGFPIPLRGVWSAGSDDMILTVSEIEIGLSGTAEQRPAGQQPVTTPSPTPTTPSVPAVDPATPPLTGPGFYALSLIRRVMPCAAGVFGFVGEEVKSKKLGVKAEGLLLGQYDSEDGLGLGVLGAAGIGKTLAGGEIMWEPATGKPHLSPIVLVESRKLSKARKAATSGLLPVGVLVEPELDGSVSVGAYAELTKTTGAGGYITLGGC